MSNELSAINERIDKMGAWARQIEETLKSVSRANDETAINGAAMSQELAGLWKQYVSPANEVRQFQRDIIVKEMELKSVEDEIELIESQAFLDVSSAIGEDGKLLYSNEAARKAAVKVAIGTNPEYRQLVESCRLIDVAISQIKADINYSEAQIKEFHYRSRAMIARIEYDTAVLNSLKGDK